MIVSQIVLNTNMHLVLLDNRNLLKTRRPSAFILTFYLFIDLVLTQLYQTIYIPILIVVHDTNTCNIHRHESGPEILLKVVLSIINQPINQNFINNNQPTTRVESRLHIPDKTKLLVTLMIKCTLPKTTMNRYYLD